MLVRCCCSSPMGLAWLAVLAMSTSAVAGESASAPVDFNRDVRAILAKSCFACHGPDEESRKAELRLDKRDSAIAKGASGQQAIKPGDIAGSELVLRISSKDENEVMPPPGSGHELTPTQIDTLKRWVGQGAPYAEHWSLVRLARPQIPEVRQQGWAKSPLDKLILQKLEQAGLTPTEEADKYELIRRLSLDLRGLPPTLAEVDEFVADQSPHANERLVDRLLGDTAFGERWARVWMDVARYADSAGYGSDPLRLNMWRYRDWVIEALNRNPTFDQFVTEQLAGDLLPNPTLDQLVATAFHRNTMTNTEGGTDDEEFRVIAVRDRVDTTLQVFMGLTMGCAKCHNHKYDPISQEEYYQFYAFFNQTADNDSGDEQPTLPAASPEQTREIERINAEIAGLRGKLNADTPELAAARQEWEKSLGMAIEWTAITPESLKTAGEAVIEHKAEGRLLVSGPLPKTDVYALSTKGDLSGVTAFRLETLPDESLPAKGAGRAPDGNFVLSRFSVTAEDAERVGQVPLAKFVRIQLPGAQKLLSLAEVQVHSAGANVALKGKASQSSTDYAGPPELAIDGNTNGNYYEGKSTTHTRQEDNPWWEVDLGSAVPVESISVFNRTDGNTATRLNGFQISLLDAARQTVWQQTVAEAPPVKQTYSPSGTQALELAQAVADYSQGGFPVANALAQKDLAASGWAVGGQISQPHWAVFSLAKPFTAAAPKLVSIRLEHLFGTGQYALGSFRLSYTKSLQVQKRLGVPANILAIVDLPEAQRTKEQQSQLAAHYAGIAPLLQPVRDQIAQLEKARPQPPAVPIMRELAEAQRRTSFLMVKGNFLVKGKDVQAAAPSQLHPFPADAPKNRLGVAKWLFDRNNPLTARVTVNRFWSQIFGVGIVETEEDFGTQGELPSHPELLDWLAMEFIEPTEAIGTPWVPAGDANAAAAVTGRPWDVKRLLKLIVMSASYRQAAKVTPAALEKDPRNRLLSRGPRYRLEAEMVRDQALMLSGLLSRKMGGPSVYPPQPPGLWQAAFNGQRNWATSMGEDKYRRGLYTFWRRTIPYPSMATFDAPSREICAIRRVRTNTPLQAFVTLNDPVYVEASQALARRIAKEGGSTPEERMRYGLRLCLCRPPAEAQVAELVTLYTAELADFQKDIESAKKLASDPLGPIPAGQDPADLAALTVVSNVLLNLDAVLSRH